MTRLEKFLAAAAFTALVGAMSMMCFAVYMAIRLA